MDKVWRKRLTALGTVPLFRNCGIQIRISVFKRKHPKPRSDLSLTLFSGGGGHISHVETSGRDSLWSQQTLPELKLDFDLHTFPHNSQHCHRQGQSTVSWCVTKCVMPRV